VNGDRLAGHLADRYGVAVTATAALDVGVVRVDRADGPSWVARVFSDARPVAEAEADAEILRRLERGGLFRRAGRTGPTRHVTRVPAADEQRAR